MTANSNRQSASVEDMADAMNARLAGSEPEAAVADHILTTEDEPLSSKTASDEAEVPEARAIDQALAVEDAAFAAEIARKAAEQADKTGEAEEAEDDNIDGDNYTESFSVAPPVPDEFLANIQDVGDWNLHPKRYSPGKGAHASALALTAVDPLAFRPLVVIKKNGKYVVVDGRYILESIRGAHSDVMVRVVLFPGTEEEAVAWVCDNALGAMMATRIEQEHALLNMQRTNRVSQRAIAERYPGLTDSKISNMLIAARVQDAHPVLYKVLEEPHRAPISYGVDLSKAIKAMTPQELQELLDRAMELDANGERFKPGDALDALEIVRSAPAASPVPAMSTPKLENVFGHDDQPVGTAERLDDDAVRLSLPPPPPSAP